MPKNDEIGRRRLKSDETYRRKCSNAWRAIVLYPLVICHSSLLKMAIEIVDSPIENGDVP
jgi:hypothetical protein